MPWEWAIPHMIAGVTAPPRWQWSSASGMLRGSSRTMTRGYRRPASRGVPGWVRPDDAIGSAGERYHATGVVEGRPAADPPEVRTGDLVAGVVARADERSRLDVAEAQCQRLGLHLGQLVGVVVALDGQVLRGWPEILADRQDVAVDGAQRVERREQLV